MFVSVGLFMIEDWYKGMRREHRAADPKLVARWSDVGEDFKSPDQKVDEAWRLLMFCSITTTCKTPS